MIAELTVPYIDVSAADLTFATDAPEIEVLDRLTVNSPAGILLELRLLGASHQAVMTLPSGATLAETVAYRPDLAPYLPTKHTQDRSNWVHEFTCETLLMGLKEFSEYAHQTHQRARNNPHLLLGVFGDELDAFTAMEVTALDPLRWRTVHTYPQYGQIVLTSSHLTSH